MKSDINYVLTDIVVGTISLSSRCEAMGPEWSLYGNDFRCDFVTKHDGDIHQCQCGTKRFSWGPSGSRMDDESEMT